MIAKVRTKLQSFVVSEHDTPLFAGFCIGLYFMVFYYARNFALAYSLQQFLFFSFYYLVMPPAILWLVSRLMKKKGWTHLRRQCLFTGTVTFFAGFLFQILHGRFFDVWVGVIAAAAFGLSFKVARYYKLLALLCLLMLLFNVKPLAGIAYRSWQTSDAWKTLPDGIENVAFKAKPNIYYIQPDGFTSFKNLKSNKYYDFDVTAYEAFLRTNGFTLYDGYRSNYHTTLLSNAATFSMKQHHAQRDVAKYAARGIIAKDNPVLRILKRNGYKTHLVIEKPYLVINRPSLGYDYCNIDYDELPYFGDGLTEDKDVFAALRQRMKNQQGSNFYFVEKFLPAHITGRADLSKGAADEAKKHMEKLKEAETWLKSVIDYVARHDPNGIIIIGADHGGFAGFDHAQQCLAKVTDKDLITSMFGATLAIKWNSEMSEDYDNDLKSGVNLFRTVFSYLSQNKSYLQHQEESSSYLDLASPGGVYRYIDDNGNIVFQPYGQ